MRSSVAPREFGQAHELPGIREICVAADRFEDGDRPTRKVAQLLGVRRRAHEGDMGALHLSSVLRHHVVVPPRVLDRFCKGGVGGLERAGAAKRPAEVGERRRAFGGLDRKEPACALELRRRGCELAAIERASTGPSQEVTSFQSVRASLGAEPTELDADEVCPLVVVSDDLLLSGRLRGLRLEPRGERVKVGAKLLGHGCIGDVSDQDMVEAEAVVAPYRDRSGRSSFARQGEEDAAQPVRAGRRQQLRDGAAMEQAPLHRSPLEHRSFSRLEAVDARREERLDGRRHGLVRGRDRRRAWRTSARRRVGCPPPRERCDRWCDVDASASSIRSIDSVSFSWESATRLVRGRGAAHDGRTSKRSGRARQRSRIGAPLEKPRTYSSRSSIVGSSVDVVHHHDERSRRGERLEEPPERKPSPPVSPARRAHRSRRE